MPLEHIVIIGNGVAGITTARHIRKHSDAQITVVGSETEHFYSRTALMYIFMGHMKFEHTKPYEDFFWEKNKIDLVYDHVEEIDTVSRSLRLLKGQAINYDKLVIATGSKTATFGWPGMELNGVRGLYSLQDMHYVDEYAASTKSAVIVGGGLIGIELAEMLCSRGIHVTMMIREDGYWRNVLPVEEARLVERHAREHGVEILLNTELASIEGDKRVTHVRTTDGSEITCQMVGLTTGVVPNVDIIKSTSINYDRGILVDHRLQTNVEGVYAAGDCAQLIDPASGRKSIEPVWYTGRKMGEVLGKRLAGGSDEYDPGPWFNSAKFFDIEYQTYGLVLPDVQSDNFYWESEDGKQCFRAVWEDGNLSGINCFGLRLRHEVIDDWLRTKAPIEEVFSNLHRASFDPEFYKDTIREIVNAYNKQFPEHQVTLPEIPWYKRIFA